MKNDQPISRRTILRGAGLALAVPWLPSLARGASAQRRPVRMACVFVPNGVHVPDWTPKSVGFGFELPPILQPLANVRSELLVLSQLTHDKGRPNGDGPGDHARSASVFLTGAQPRKTDGNAIRVGISADQVAAQAVGQHTRFPSIGLGCEEGRTAGECDSGYSCAYSSNISWSSASTPVGKEINPRLAFERLFASSYAADLHSAASPSALSHSSAAERLSMRKSVLDYVTRDAQSLQRKVSSSDRKKLDEYFHAIRELELRLERSAGDPRYDVPRVDYRPPSGIPDDYAQHIRLMCDMVVLAFQTDSTRVVSLMMANAGSNRRYHELDIPEGHHDLSHHQGDAEKHAKIRSINRFHIEQLAYLLEKLHATREGDGTLLDSCMVLYGSGISDGDQHNHDNLPILLAGGGGGTIDPGRHIEYPAETPMANLLLAMLHRMGAQADYFGDSTAPLSGLQI